MMFNDGVPMLVWMSHPGSIAEVRAKKRTFFIASAWLSMPSSETAYIRLSPDVVWLLIVRFKPEGFYRLPELSAKELSSIPFREITFLFGKTFPEKVNSISHLQGKIQFIEESVRKVVSGQKSTNKLLEEAIVYIREQNGNATITEIARQLKVNYKWLERNFSYYIGVTPKSYGCLVRFIHAYADLTSTPQKDMMGIATENGYYDQSHFIREFRQFTGKTPLQYLQKTYFKH